MRTGTRRSNRVAAEEARQALRRYLELRPEASDAEMVRFTFGQ